MTTTTKQEKYPAPFDERHCCIFCSWRAELNDSGSVPDQLRRHERERAHLRDHEERGEIYSFPYGGAKRWKACR